jgi:hypothetical protein
MIERQDEDMRIAALMLAIGGCSVRDIGKVTRVTDEQVRAWLEQSSR